MRRMTERERNDFLNRLLAAKTANEMTSLIGLKPLRGDVPRLFYLARGPEDAIPQRDGARRKDGPTVR